SMVADLSLSDLMIKNPITAGPDDDVEAAARVIYHRKIGGLPVVDKKNKLVGILTVIDILRSFIEMMGLLTESTRLDIDIGEDPEAVNRAVSAITSAGGRILSIAVAAHRKDRNILYFRIAPENGGEVAKALQQEGFAIVGGTQ
ncbi:MAG: CBS domain-containing protein, partial [Thermodesulfobacteriota bacterium]